MGKRALVTGITGQDGAYLAQLLLEKGYEVFGGYRPEGSADFSRLAELGIAEEVRRIPFDLTETSNILSVVERTRPDEIYNLAAQSSVALSYEQPVSTADADALGVVRFLEAVRTVDEGIRFFQASTSEMFGKTTDSLQNEATRFYPRSPYAVAKLYAHWITVNYRESYGIHACSGILFNHESPLRSRSVVTRKISSGFALMRAGLLDTLELGNLAALRDWGFAGDYVDGMWRMLQDERADDYVLATGRAHSVEEFVVVAARAAGFDLVFEGADADRRGRDRKTGRTLTRTNPRFYRPADVDRTVGDATKARERLGWQATVRFEELVSMMVSADIRRVEGGSLSV
ncbi:MAG: GDP-mannose 4,6-dehydratase [Fimbriimonas sp.]